MNLSAFRQKLQSAKQQIIDSLPKISEEIAVSTLSLVKNRSIEDGIIIEGKAGSEKSYSAEPVNTSFFEKKVLNSGGKTYIEKNKKGTWGGFRKAQGLQSDNVNLSYTSRMWTGLQVIKVTINGKGKCQSVIGAADEETRVKLAANLERYGNFLEPTPDELRMAQDIAKERLEQIIRGQ